MKKFRWGSAIWGKQAYPIQADTVPVFIASISAAISPARLLALNCGSIMKWPFENLQQLHL